MNWDEWEPGDKDGAELLRTPGWLKSALKASGIETPDLSGLDFAQVSEVLAKETEKGSAEQTTVKALLVTLNIERDLAEFLAHTGNVLVASYRDLANFESDSKIEWLSSGCCDLCDSNEGHQIQAGTKFPSGHLMPPACSYCLCCLLPVIDY